jgi:hypothetical protein
MSTDFAAVVSSQATGLGSVQREPLFTPAQPVKAQSAPPETEEQPASTFRTRSLDQTIQFPEYVATLRVHMVSKDQFRLECLNPVVPSPQRYEDSPTYGSPRLALGVIADEGGKEPRIISQDMLKWSKRFDSGKIRDWLNALRERFGDDLHLLIDDATGMEIPWELLYLPKSSSSAEEAGWLGALIATVRRAHHAFQNPSASIHGGVVGYLDGTLGGTRREQEVINKLERKIHHDSDDFLTTLCTATPDVGLVFMACHGVFSASTATSELGGLSLGDFWEAEELHEGGLQLLRLSRCLAFLNACHSGRLVHDDDLGDQPTDELHGFVDVFLGNGASGVVATLGKVGTDAAADLSVLVLNEAMDNGVAIAKLLRDWRAQAVLQLNKVRERQPRPEPKQYLPFLYAFMYVYYGEPLAVLQLTRRTQVGDY